MQRDYVSNEGLRILCRKLMSLALMPKELVVASFWEIQAAVQDSNNNQMGSLLTYFENNWLGNIDLWNVFQCEMRSNNVCEGNNVK